MQQPPGQGGAGEMPASGQQPAGNLGNFGPQQGGYRGPQGMPRKSESFIHFRLVLQNFFGSFHGNE